MPNPPHLNGVAIYANVKRQLKGYDLRLECKSMSERFSEWLIKELINYPRVSVAIISSSVRADSELKTWHCITPTSTTKASPELRFLQRHPMQAFSYHVSLFKVARRSIVGLINVWKVCGMPSLLLLLGLPQARPSLISQPRCQMRVSWSLHHRSYQSWPSTGLLQRREMAVKRTHVLLIWLDCDR